MMKSRMGSCVAAALLAASATAQDGGPSGDAQAAKVKMVAARTPALQRWTAPAEFASVRASDEGNYDTLDLAIEWSKQYAGGDGRFHKVSFAPYWQNSSKDDKPVNDRGLSFGYTYFPGSACADSPTWDCGEWLYAADVAWGRIKEQDPAVAASYVDNTHTTVKASAAYLSRALAKGTWHLSGVGGFYHDRRRKAGATVPNGTESGAYLRPSLIFIPAGLDRRYEAGTVELEAIAQYQYGLDSSGARERENHRWFKLSAAISLGSYGSGKEQWQPSIALQRSGGEDATLAIARRYESKVAFRLKYGVPGQ